MSDVPHSVWQGSFRVFGVDIKCHVLSDGQRVIEAESMHNLMEAMANGSLDPMDTDNSEVEFANWIHGRGKPP